MAANGPVASGEHNEPAFAWWYFFVKWALPIMLALATGAFIGLALTGVITAEFVLGVFGLAAPVAFDSFVGIAWVSSVVGTAAGMVGLLTTLLVRGSLLFNVLENNLSASDTRCTGLEQRLTAATTELQQFRNRDQAERRDLLAQHGQALYRMGGLEAMATSRGPQPEFVQDPRLEEAAGPPAIPSDALQPVAEARSDAQPQAQGIPEGALAGAPLIQLATQPEQVAAAQPVTAVEDEQRRAAGARL